MQPDELHDDPARNSVDDAAWTAYPQCAAFLQIRHYRDVADRGELLTQLVELREVVRFGVLVAGEFDTAPRRRVAQTEPQREEFGVLGAMGPELGTKPMNGFDYLAECRCFAAPHRPFHLLGGRQVRGEFALRIGEPLHVLLVLLLRLILGVDVHAEHEQRAQRDEYHRK